MMVSSIKYGAVGAGSFLILLAGGLWLRAQQADTRQLASLLPSGAQLYLEAQDFRSLLDRWNSSAERKRWLASGNFGVLSQSRLIQRLGEAQDQFAATSGVAPGMDLLGQIAGGRSAFAFYDLGGLKFVYLSETSNGTPETNDLLQARAKYQPREVAGISFYVRSDAGSGRTVCFASYQRWFVVATDEARMAQTLALLAAGKAPSLATDAWFKEALQSGERQGELRLVYNLDALLKTPQFRTYWVQRNASELKQYGVGVADLVEAADGFEERRALLRKTESQPAAASSLERILARIPRRVSLYRAWANPERTRISEVLNQVVFGERAEGPAWQRYAPQVSLDSAVAGSASDFETRIDEPRPVRGAQASLEPLLEAIVNMQPLALAHVQTTEEAGDQIFVMPQSGAILHCKRADQQALESALAQVAGLLENGRLDRLRVLVEGDLVAISRLDLTQSRGVPAATNAAYYAVFDRAAEWPHYRRLFGLIDRSANNPEMPAAAGTPSFFSGNVQSLGEALGRLQSASIEEKDEDRYRRETVKYRFSTP